LRSREDAEDAVQNTFLGVYGALQRGIVPEFEAAWLYKIAHNVCLSRRLGASRRGRVESPADLQELEERLPGRETDGYEELFGLDDALAAMPENLRRAILLREWQGLSYAEIAEVLEISKSAVETLIFRARRHLAQALVTAVKQPVRHAAGALNLGWLVNALRGLLGAGGTKLAAAGFGVVAAGLAGGGYGVSQALSDTSSRSVSAVTVTGGASSSPATPAQQFGKVAPSSLFGGSTASPSSAKPARSSGEQTQLPSGSGSFSSSAGVSSGGVAAPSQVQLSQAPAATGSEARGSAAASSGSSVTGSKPPAPASTVSPTPTAAVPLPPAPSIPGVLQPPSVSVPSVTTPTVSTPTTSVIDQATSSLPEVSVPQASVPTESLPTVSVPKASLPDTGVTTPSVSVPTATVPGLPTTTTPTLP
jgi:RNA polymerase sigma factor (sigma-70 family)